MTSKNIIFRVAIFQKIGGLLCKKIELGEHDLPVSDSSDCKMAFGNGLPLSARSNSVTLPQPIRLGGRLYWRDVEVIELLEEMADAK